MTSQEAEEFCREYGGRLLYIDSTEKHEAVEDILRKLQIFLGCFTGTICQGFY